MSTQTSPFGAVSNRDDDSPIRAVTQSQAPLEVKIDTVRVSLHENPSSPGSSSHIAGANEATEGSRFQGIDSRSHDGSRSHGEGSRSHDDENARELWPSFLLAQYSLSTRIDGATMHRKIRKARMLQHRRQDFLGTFPILALLRTKLMKFGLLVFAAYAAYRTVEAASVAAGASQSKASVVRFSALELRGGGSPSLANPVDNIILSKSACAQLSSKVEMNGATVTVWHDGVIQFDRWAYDVGGEDPEMDAVKWGVEISTTNGSSWEKLQMHKSLSWDWQARPGRERGGRVEIQQRPWLILTGRILSYCVVAFSFSAALVLLQFQDVAGARRVLTCGTCLGFWVNLIMGSIITAQFEIALCGAHFRNAAILGLIFPCVASARLERHFSLGLCLGGLSGVVTILVQARADNALLEGGLRLLSYSLLSGLGLVLMLQRQYELLGFQRRATQDKLDMDQQWQLTVDSLREHPEVAEQFRNAVQSLSAQVTSTHPVQQVYAALEVGAGYLPEDPRPEEERGAQGQGEGAKAGPLSPRWLLSSPRSMSGSQQHARVDLGHISASALLDQHSFRLMHTWSVGRASPLATPHAGASDRNLLSQAGSGQAGSATSRGSRRGSRRPIREPVKVKGLDQVFSQAYGCVLLLRDKVGQWAGASGGWMPVTGPREARGDAPREYMLYSQLCHLGQVNKVHWTPLKPEAQAVDKVLYRYDGRVEKLLDACRESIAFESIQSLTCCLLTIAADADVKIERVTNSMEVSSAAAGTGFRGVVLNMRIVHGDAVFLGVEGHICELILLLRPIAQLQSAAAHQDYLLMRTMKTMNHKPCSWSDSTYTPKALLLRAFGFSALSTAVTGSGEATTSMSHRERRGEDRGSGGARASMELAALEHGRGAGAGGFAGLRRRDPRFRDGAARRRRSTETDWYAGAEGRWGEARPRSSLASTFSQAVYEQWLLRMWGKAWGLEDPQLPNDNPCTKLNNSIFTTSFPLTVAMSRPWFPLGLSVIALIAFSLRTAFLFNHQTPPQQARFLRYTALELRNGFRSADAELTELEAVPPVTHSLGILLGDCERELRNGSVSRNGTLQSFQLEETLNVTGFYFRTLAKNPELDPVAFTFETSMDGEQWAVLGSSRQFVAFSLQVAWLNETFQTPTARHAKVEIRNEVPWWFLGLALLESLLVCSGFLAMAVWSVLHRYGWGTPTLTWLLGSYTCCQFVRVIMVHVHRKFVIFPFSLMSGFLGAILTAMILWKERLVFEGVLVTGLGWALIITVNRQVLYPESGVRNENLEAFVTPGVLVVLGATFLVLRHFAWRAAMQKVKGDIEQYDAAWAGVWGDAREREALQRLHRLLVRSHGHQHLLNFHAQQKFRSLDALRPQRVTSLDLLYTQAAGLAPMLIDKVKAWAAISRGRLPTRCVGSDAHEMLLWSEVEGTEAEGRVRWAALKAPERAVEKLVLSYNGRAWLLLDIGRQRLVFEHAWELERCVKAILTDSDVRVVRSKNRLRPDYDPWRSAGYRDVNLAFQITTSATRDLGLDRHVLELQLALLDMEKLKTRAAHLRYIEFRDARAE